MRRIRAIVIGVGVTASGIHKVMVEKGVEIVGAVDIDPNKVGKDLGEVIGFGRPLNVLISDDRDKTLSEIAADIVFVCADSSIDRMYTIYEKCITCGLNVIAMANTDVYPWTLYPEHTSRIDRLAKKHKVTVSASGNQDVLLCHLPIAITGCCTKIESITGRATNDLNGVGVQVCKDSRVGETMDEYLEAVGDCGGSQLYFRAWLESIAASLDLTVKSATNRDEPIIYDEDVECIPMGKVISKGLIAGMKMTTKMETEQGITLIGEYTGKIYKKGEVGIREWIIKGTPDMHIDYYSPGVPGVTRGAQLVNRIPDVINMTPGFVTLESYPKLKYRHQPLHCYLK